MYLQVSVIHVFLQQLEQPLRILGNMHPGLLGIGLTLLLVSDGSAGNNSMSSVWVLALPCGKRVATCASSVFGFRELSYSSKYYGVLSAVWFVSHLFQFCGYAPQWGYKYMADDIGLLTALLQDAPYTEA
jgi:hypothetical protein